MQTELERKAQRLGVSVSALRRPRHWAPFPVRREKLRQLYRQGLTQVEVWKFYPNEDPNVLSQAGIDVRLEQERALRDLL